ncbi:MAG: 3'-5' exonuclease domain-containing protein 2 [Bacteroidales bacterium]|nr:3'-5' exonuclease domain-containing protein 2 [Bacteroidales bacterium]
MILNKSIDKEQIKQYPLQHYEGDIVVVNTMEHFLEVFPQICQCSICGIDTETLPCFKKGGKLHPVALLQVATDHCVYLIRLCKIGFNQYITDFFENQNICKIGIGCADDLHALRRLGNISPKNMIDLNTYCKQLGFESIGAKKLTALILGFTISKRQQTSNWENEELSNAQIQYAATDAWICREIYLKLTEQQ